MLEFKEIKTEDRVWATELLSKADFRGCEYSFGNNFAWRNIYNLTICRYKDFYIVKSANGGKTRFFYPAGNGDEAEVLDELMRYSKALNQKLDLIVVPKQKLEFLQQLYGDKIEFSGDRDDFDYIYNAEDLAELKGKKYHGKRNHINRFMENNWSFEPITAANIPECLEMNAKWCEENGCAIEALDDVEITEEMRSKADESCVVRCSFKHFDELGYTGGVLRVDGVVQAFTFGEKINSDTFVVHVEKALETYQGAYTMINMQFVKSLGDKFKYINREEDTGAENLRKAKLSYKPVFLEEKYNVTFK